MPNIVWSPQLAIGNDKIDNEHKQLIRIANAFLRALNGGRDKSEFTRLLHELREYTVLHFNNEEEFMRTINYPDLAEHMDRHAELKRKVKDFQRDLFHGQDMDVPRMRDMLKDWLLGHILECDLKLKTFLTARTEPQHLPQTKKKSEEA